VTVSLIARVATGVFALNTNNTGNNNTANGMNALFNNTTGINNIGVGVGAGSNLTTGSNNIEIGNLGVAAESNTVRIGTQGTQTAAFIAGIAGSAIGNGQPVRVNAQGKLGTVASSARFKQAIKPMAKSSEAILALKPVTFQYKKEIDPEGAPQFGLIAEEVDKVNPDLVARDEQGKPYTVRYEAVNAMLLNEFLKAHGQLQEQQATISEQEKEIGELKQALKEQAAQIRKVSEQVAFKQINDALGCKRRTTVALW
jgi:hypothetical protein